MKTEKTDRYYFLDAVRGVCILGMIIYHTLFDIVAFFGGNMNETAMLVIDVIRDLGASCFICLSGICMHFGKKPFKRFLTIFTASLIVSGVTYLVMPELPIVYGILTFMAFAALIMIPLKKLLDRLPAVIFAPLCLILFLMSFEFSDGYSGWYFMKLFELPEVLYRNYFTAFLGFPQYGFISADYYPVFPWIFMFLFGFFLWKLLEKSEAVIKIMRIKIPFVGRVGEYSLYIYIIHQPIIMGLLMLFAYLYSLSA